MSETGPEGQQITRAGRARRGAKRAARGAALGVGGVVLVVVALLAGVLIFVFNPPSDLVRRAVLPVARELLSHPRIQVGGMTLLPGSRIELRDLLIGPPNGYSKPLLRIGALVLRYDLSRILDGEVTIQQVQLDRPVVHLEYLGRKTNWQAFLEALASGEEEEEEEEEESGSSDLKVRLDRVAIKGFAAALQDGAREVVLDRLDLALDGFYSRKDSDLRLRLTLAPRQKGGTSLHFKQTKPRPAEADLNARLDLKVRLGGDLSAGLRAGVGLEVDIHSRKLRADGELAPLDLALRLAASADLLKNRAKLERLELALGDEQLIDLRGEVTRLSGNQEIDLTLRQLRLPLDRLVPYARPFLTGVKAGGLVELRDLRLRGDRQQLEALMKPAATPPSLPRLSALLRLVRLKLELDKAGLAGMDLKVKDLDLDLALAAGGGAAGATPEAMLAAAPDLSAPPSAGSLAGAGAQVALLARLNIGTLTGFGVDARGADLRLSAGLGLDAGLQPGPAGIRAALRIPTLIYTSRATGRMKMKVAASLEASAQVRQQRAMVQRLELNISDLIKARLQGDFERWGAGKMKAKLQLQPVDLARTVAWLPRRLKAPLGGAALAGKVGLEATLQGKLPGGGALRPLAMPLSADLRLALSGVRYDQGKGKLSAGPVAGALTARIKPGKLALSGGLTLGKLSRPADQLTAEGISLTPEVRLDRGKLEGRLLLGLERLVMKKLGLTGGAFKLDHRLAAALPGAALVAGRPARLGKTSASATWEVGSLRMAQPANTITLKGKETRLTVAYDPAGGGVSDMGLKLTLASVRHEEQGLDLADLRLAFDDRISGHGDVTLPAPRVHLRGLSSTHRGSIFLGRARHGGTGVDAAKVALSLAGSATGVSLDGPTPKVEHISQQASLKLGSLSARGGLERPLVDSSLELDVEMNKLTDLNLRKLSLRAPSRGVYFDVKGRGEGLIPLDINRLPPFELELSAGLDNKKVTEEAASKFLAPGVRGGGKLGAKLKLASDGPGALRLDGRLLARAFHIWQRGGTSGGRASHVHLSDLNADMPFSQRLLIRDGRPRLPPPERPLTAISSRSPLYAELRPYTSRAAGLTLGGLTVERQTAAGSQRLRVDGARLDLTLADNALKMRRLYLKLFGGDIAGALQVQLLSLAPLDLVLQLRTQVTGVNLAYLDPEAKEYTEETEVSALLDLGYRPAKEELAGRVEITRLSVKMLDAMLAYLDPDRTNGSVQENRKLLAAWYMKWIDPRVNLVSLWIKHGNLNMDIDMDAWFVVGSILKRMLRNMQVRRLNVLPVLRREVTPALRKLERSLGGTTTKEVARR